MKIYRKRRTEPDELVVIIMAEGRECLTNFLTNYREYFKKSELRIIKRIIGRGFFYQTEFDLGILEEVSKQVAIDNPERIDTDYIESGYNGGTSDKNLPEA